MAGAELLCGNDRPSELRTEGSLRSPAYITCNLQTCNQQVMSLVARCRQPECVDVLQTHKCWERQCATQMSNSIQTKSSAAMAGLASWCSKFEHGMKGLDDSVQ